MYTAEPQIGAPLVFLLARVRPVRSSVALAHAVRGDLVLDELIVLSGRGDQVAFANLYDIVAGRIHGLVLRVLRDPAQTEEVTQEVFLELWKRSPRFDPARGSGLAWAMTIAHRRAVDRVRSEQTFRNHRSRIELAGQPAPFDEVSEVVEDQWEQRRVRKALESLTDAQRQAVELAYFGGYTYREVGELLETPLGTVKTRIRSALLRMRSEMEATR